MSETKTAKYIHGYQEVEQERLRDQAYVIENPIYDFIDFGTAQTLLEIGSGVGAQTEILLRRFPHLSITGIEYEAKQIETAWKNLLNQGYSAPKVNFIQQDATNLSLESSFDAAFVCWVLEHVQDPLAVLVNTRNHLKPGAKIVVTEVFNATFFTFPYKKELMDYWTIYNSYQEAIGGDPHVGAKLGNLLEKAGFQNIELRSGGFHLDNRDIPQRTRVFNYWKNLMSSGAPALLEEGLINQEQVSNMQAAMDELRDTENSVFYYSFIQATAFA